MHYARAFKHRRISKYLEKNLHETKKYLGIHIGGEVMKSKDHHESRAIADRTRKKRKYTKKVTIFNR